MSEVDMSFEEVLEACRDESFSPYGQSRIYCEYADDTPYSGQIGSVKSEQQALEARNKYGVKRWYMVTRTHVPIKRAGRAPSPGTSEHDEWNLGKGR